MHYISICSFIRVVNVYKLQHTVKVRALKYCVLLRLSSSSIQMIMFNLLLPQTVFMWCKLLYVSLLELMSLYSWLVDEFASSSSFNRTANHFALWTIELGLEPTTTAHWAEFEPQDHFDWKQQTISGRKQVFWWLWLEEVKWMTIRLTKWMTMIKGWMTIITNLLSNSHNF